MAATTAGIFAVFRMGRAKSLIQNPAYVRSRPTFCIRKTTRCDRGLRFLALRHPKCCMQ